MAEYGRIPRRLLRELGMAAVLVAIGVLALPAAVFHTGARLFGPYSGGHNGGLGSFYADVLHALGEGHAVAWLLVLSPWLCIALFRAGFSLLRRSG